MDPLDYRFALLALFLLLSNVVEAATGFGATIIALTLAVHFYPIDFLVGIIVPLNVLVSAYIVIRYHAGIDRKKLFGRILPLAGIGMPAGIALFNLIDTERLKVAFGVFVLCFSFIELIRILRAADVTKMRPLSAASSAFWLILGGVVHGIYASGGPMIVYYSSRNLTNKHNFRSTLSGLWLILSIVLLISHIATGKITAEIGKASVLMLPVVAVGIVCGEWLHRRLNERSFRIVVFSILVFAGASIVVRAF